MKTTTRRTIFFVVATALALGTGCARCAGDDAPQPTTSTAPAEPPDAGASPTAKPAYLDEGATVGPPGKGVTQLRGPNPLWPPQGDASASPQ